VPVATRPISSATQQIQAVTQRRGPTALVQAVVVVVVVVVVVEVAEVVVVGGVGGGRGGGQKELEVQNQFQELASFNVELARFRTLLDSCQDGECVDGCNRRHCNCSVYVPAVTNPAPTVTTSMLTGCNASNFFCNCTTQPDTWQTDPNWNKSVRCSRLKASMHVALEEATTKGTSSSGDRARRLGGGERNGTKTDCDYAKIALDQIKVKCDKSAITRANRTGMLTGCDTSNFFCNTTKRTNGSGDRARRQARIMPADAATSSCTNFTDAAKEYADAIVALNYDAIPGDIDTSSTSKAGVGAVLAASVALLAATM
jgi:hypothetical protein